MLDVSDGSWELPLFFCGLTVKKLTDQIFQNNSGLRHFDLVSGREVGLVSSRFKTDILFTKQSGSQDFRAAVFWKFVALLQLERNECAVILIIERNVL